MKCPYCKASIPENSIFCENCGQEIINPTGNSQDNTTNSPPFQYEIDSSSQPEHRTPVLATKWTKSRLGLILFAFVAIIFFVFSIPKTAEPIQDPIPKRLISVVRTTSDEQRTYNFEYDDAGKITKISGNEVTKKREYPFLQDIVYDSDGRLFEIWDRINSTAVPNAENNGWEEVPLYRYQYDDNGQLVYTLLSHYYRTDYFYDEHGNLVGSYFPHDTGSRTTSYQYDAQNILRSTITYEEYDEWMENPNCTVYSTYEYDRNGNTVAKNVNCVYEDGNEESFTYNYTYDSQGRLLTKEKVGADTQEEVICYDYFPFIADSDWDSYDKKYNTTLRIQDSVGHDIWCIYQIFNPQYTLDESGYVTQITEDGYDGDGSTIEFIYSTIIQ